MAFTRVFYCDRIGIWVLGFVDEGKQENLEKNPQSKPRTNNQLEPHKATGRNRTQATPAEGERLSLLPIGSNYAMQRFNFFL